MKVIHERFPYKYVTCGDLEINGKPDCRILKFDEYTERYKTMYYCDNMDQMMTAIEDFEYTKWLDPSGPPCYVRDESSDTSDTDATLIS